MHSPSRIDQLIGMIYEAPLGASGWDGITPALGEELGGGVAIFAHSAAGVSTIARCSACDAEMVTAYERSLWHHDRAMERVTEEPVGTVVLDSELVDRHQRLKSPFYNDYLGRVGSDRGLYSPFLRSAGDTFVVSAQRDARHGDFGSAEIALLRTLNVHLERSFRTWRRLQALEKERAAALLGLDQSGLGLLVVDRSGAPQFANEAAEAALQGNLLRLVGGRLETDRRSETVALQRAIARVTDAQRGESHTVVLSGSDGRPSCSVIVTPMSEGLLMGAREPLAMLLIDSTQPRKLDERKLRDRFGLTPAELRLLAALIAGDRIAHYAANAGVSITTVKTHLSALFDKTGKRRQADLIRFALEIGR